MPFNTNLTPDEIVRRVAETAVGPTRARQMGAAPETDEQKTWETAHSNACYFVLSSLGLTHDEIVAAFNAVQ